MFFSLYYFPINFMALIAVTNAALLFFSSHKESRLLLSQQGATKHQIPLFIFTLSECFKQILLQFFICNHFCMLKFKHIMVLDPP